MRIIWEEFDSEIEAHQTFLNSGLRAEIDRLIENVTIKESVDAYISVWSVPEDDTKIRMFCYTSECEKYPGTRYFSMGLEPFKIYSENKESEEVLKALKNLRLFMERVKVAIDKRG